MFGRMRICVWLCCILWFMAGYSIVPQKVISGEKRFLQPKIIMRLGRGEVNASAWSPDGTIIAIGSSRGIWFYTSDLKDVAHWDDEFVKDLHWHPGSEKIATLGQEKVTVWNTTSNKVEWKVEGAVKLGGWNSDGSLLAIQTTDNGIQIWDDSTQNIVTVCEELIEQDLSVVSVFVWNPIEDLIALLGRHEIRICDATTGHIGKSIPIPDSAYGLDDIEWSPNGDSLAVSGEFGIWVWKITEFSLIYLRPEKPLRINSLAWSPEGTYIAGAALTSILIWDLQTYTISNEIRLTTEKNYGGLGRKEFRHVDWNPDGRLLLTTTIGSVQVIDSTANIGLASSYLHTGPVNTLDWNMQGQLAVGYGDREYTNKGDHRIRIWDSNTGDLLQTCINHKGTINTLAWKPFHAELVSGSGSFYQGYGNVTIWDTITCDPLQVFDIRAAIEIPSIDLNSNATQIAIDAYAVVLLCNVNKLDDCEILEDFSLVSWNPDGTLLAGHHWESRGNRVIIFDPLTKQISELGGHEKTINSISWSPDGNKIASSSDDGTIRLWDVENQDELVVLKGHRGSVLSVAWSPDGSKIASAGKDHTVRVWNPRTGELLSILEAHESGVTSVAWDPTTNLLASGSADGTVIIWEF